MITIDIASWIEELMDAKYELGYKEGYSAGANVSKDAVETLKYIGESKLRRACNSGYNDGMDFITLVVADAINDIALGKREVPYANE